MVNAVKATELVEYITSMLELLEQPINDEALPVLVSALNYFLDEHGADISVELFNDITDLLGGISKGQVKYLKVLYNLLSKERSAVIKKYKLAA